MCGEGLLLTGEVCYDAVRAANWAPSHVGGLTLGADPIAYAVALHATRLGSRLDAFAVRKARKTHGVRKQIEGGLPPAAQVVIVEDSVTSGGSALQAASAVVAHGCRILGVLALVDRGEGGRERIAQAGYELQAVFEASELLEEARSLARAEPVQSTNRSGMTKHR